MKELMVWHPIEESPPNVTVTYGWILDQSDILHTAKLIEGRTHSAANAHV